MSDVLNEFDGDVIIPLSDKEIFKKIWTKPKEVFAYLEDVLHDKWTFPILMISGAFSSLENLFDKTPYHEIDIGNIFISAVIGGFFWFLWYLIYCALMAWAGRYLKGEAGMSSLRRALAYGGIPGVVGMLLAIPIWILQNPRYGYSAMGNYVSAAMGLIVIILAIWSLVLIIIGIAYVQKFSIGKAILNFIAPIFIVLVPLGLLFYLYTALS